MEAFRRYTNLSDLIFILREKRVTLRDPRQWDDKNDSYYLEKYKEAKGLKTLLALCFAEASSETYHHWRVFSSGVNGVCIELDKHHIVEEFKKKCKKDGIEPIHGCMKYVKIGELKTILQAQTTFRSGSGFCIVMRRSTGSYVPVRRACPRIGDSRLTLIV